MNKPRPKTQTIEAPALLIQWEEEKHVDELSDIQDILIRFKNERSDLNPPIQVTRVLIRGSSVTHFKTRLMKELCKHQNLQILYLSGHHTVHGFAPSSVPKRTISYAELAQILQQGIAPHLRGIDLVFGSCNAMDIVGGTKKEQTFPPSIGCVWGFKGRPKTTEVAGFMVEVMIYNRELQNQMQERIRQRIQITPINTSMSDSRKFSESLDNEVTARALSVINNSLFNGSVSLSIRDQRTGVWTRHD